MDHLLFVTSSERSWFPGSLMWSWADVMMCVHSTRERAKGDCTMFLTMKEVEALTEDQALAVVKAAADILQRQLDAGPVALDDGGDYLAAAVDNYHRLFHAYWDNDGDPTIFVQEVKAFLQEDPESMWGGSDGEIRFEILPEPRWS